MKIRKIKSFIVILIIIIIFLLASYFVNQNIDFFKGTILDSYWGMSVYFILINLEIVLGFASLIPLIPVASSIWGSLTSFLLVWSGWTLGSLFILIISRRIGIPLLEKFSSVKELEKYRKFIPKNKLFLSVILIRLLLPIDIMSYAICLFTKIKWKKYTLATLIGYAPWCFFLAYFGDISSMAKIILGIVGLAALVLLSVFRRKVMRWWEMHI